MLQFLLFKYVCHLKITIEKKGAASLSEYSYMNFVNIDYIQNWGLAYELSTFIHSY